MTSDRETAQLQFWRGDFGNTYTDRNAAEAGQLRARVALWAAIWRCFIGGPPGSVLEVGANIGNNLRALRTLSSATFHAVEPNARARQRLIDDAIVPASQAYDGFAARLPLDTAAVDLAFTSGVLIHIHPDDLLASCREIHRVARRYVVCIEYFSDRAEEISYRGHAERLFKRDFGGFWLDNFADLRLLDYGFAWKRTTGLDNLTWWAFEKRG